MLAGVVFVAFECRGQRRVGLIDQLADVPAQDDTLARRQAQGTGFARIREVVDVTPVIRAPGGGGFAGQYAADRGVPATARL
jgi:hypothetical protein